MDEIKERRISNEIKRLEKEKNKPELLGYAFYFLFIITIVYLVDEVSTNIGKFMDLDVIVAFFGDELKYNASSAKALVDTFIAAISGISMFLRPLADRYGRKIFLFLYTLGMGIAMFLISIVHSIPGWAIGTLLIQICIPHDMQQVYIQECAPKEKRGTYFSLIKGIATLGLMLVPILRIVFNVETSENSWRYVYLTLGILGIVIAILAAIFMRESDVYIDSRLKQLRMTEEEKLEYKKMKEDDAKRGSIVTGIIHLFKHKQLLWLTISMSFVMMAYVLTSSYNTIASAGCLLFNGMEITSANYKIEVVKKLQTSIIFTYPIGCAILEFLPGVLGDKLGRKRSAIIFGASALILYLLFYLGTINVWNPYILGLLIGGACGAVWGCGDLILLMVSESTETNLRVSVNTSTLMIAGMIYAIVSAVVSAVGVKLGDSMLGILTFIVSMFGLAVGVTLLMIKSKETNGVDMNDIKTKEFEK